MNKQKNTITNRQAICDALMCAAQSERDIIVLCSDSSGSASLTPFKERYPEQIGRASCRERV